MATKPKSNKIASQAALQAVEEALDLDMDLGTSPNDSSIEELERKLTDVADDMREEASKRGASTSSSASSDEFEAVQPKDFLPANDDRKNTVAELVYSLQQKPSPFSLLIALLFAGAWIALVATYINYTDQSVFADSQNLSQKLQNPKIYLYLGLAIIPALLIFGLALLLRRAQEMRIAARSMTEAAIRLMQPEDIAADSINTVGRAIRREVTAIGDGVERALNRAGDLEQLVQNEVMSIQRSYSDSEIRLRTLLSDLTTERENIVGHAERLKSSISGSHTGLTEELDQASGRIQSAIDLATEKMSDTLAERGQGVSATLVETGEKLASVLNSSSADIESKFAERTKEFGENINLAGSTMASLIDTQSAKLSEQSNSVVQQFEDAMSIRSSEFVSRIGESGEQLQTLLDTRFHSLDDTISSKGDAFVQALGMRTDALDKVLSDRTSMISDTLKERLSNFGQFMSSHLEEVSGELVAREQGIIESSEKIIQRTADAEQAMASSQNNLAKMMQEGVSSFSDKADELNQNLVTHNAEYINIIQNGISAVGNKATEIQNSLEAQSASLVTEMDQGSKAMLQGMDDRIQDLTNSISSNTSSLNELMDEKSQLLLSGLESGNQGIATAISDKGVELGNILAQGERLLMDSAENKYGLFSQMLADKKDAISTELDIKIEATAGLIDQKAAMISDVLTERAALVNSTLGESLTDSQRMLETKTHEFNELLERRSTELTAIIDEKAQPLIDTLDNQGVDVAVKLGAVHEAVNLNVTDLLGKLGDISGVVGELINNANQDLGEIQGSIISQANELAETVNKTRENVEFSTELAHTTQTRMDETSTSLMANIGDIATRFEQQGQMLQNATNMIDNIHREFSGNLAERESAIQVLANGLSQRSNEIEESMAAFGTMLTSTMDEMTQKSRLVGSTISSEIGIAIEETTARFSAATQAMHQASQEVQHDLEETRLQMRKGVMELPDETRQSADAMRKVVADQIAALRDLSEIVTKSGNALDAAPARKVANVRTTAPAPVAQVAPAPMPPQTQRAPQPQARQAPFRAPPSRQPMSPAPRVNPGVQPVLTNQAPPSSAPTGASGWVSDLLKRASVEEPAPAPLHRIESLNSISMDIARLMDHEASIELWERYQRGERNVFTRKLYTSQGQQTFEEIRMKYGQEPEFKRAVDRYIDDFERLLADVAGNDRDNIMTQTYLTSDTGKVYTMLAHASGRFGA